jgi:hypothetical protein
MFYCTGRVPRAPSASPPAGPISARCRRSSSSPTGRARAAPLPSSATTGCSRRCRSASSCSPDRVSRPISRTRPRSSAFRCGVSPGKPKPTPPYSTTDAPVVRASTPLWQSLRRGFSLHAVLAESASRHDGYPSRSPSDPVVTFPPFLPRFASYGHESVKNSTRAITFPHRKSSTESNRFQCITATH